MDKKLELIKEAYGEFYDALKNSINESGYIRITRYSFEEDEEGAEAFDNFLLKTSVDSELGDFAKFYRPTSLKGLDDNNGWTTISGVEDYPKETGYYWLMRGREKCINYIIVPESYKREEFMLPVTHYKKLPETDLPVY